MNYKFTEVFDIPSLTKVCDAFTQYSGMVTALIDLEGQVHIATGWQDICTKFHRVNEKTAARCKESDKELSKRLEAGKDFSIYRCKNGLVDVAVPIIIRGEHVGSFFTGQFFFETPNEAFFKAQAKRFDFDQVIYMDALNRVPIFTEEQVRKNVDFLVKLTQHIGEVGLEKLKTLEREKHHSEELEQLVQERTEQLTYANHELELANIKLSNMARVDELTQLSNRRALDELVEKEWPRLSRSGLSVSIIMLDVDHFKLFNDFYGHLTGDICLKKIAKCLKANMQRPTDYAFRFGGEEFICVLLETSLEGAAQVAEAIQASLREMAISHQASPIDSFVTVSIGVVNGFPAKLPSSNDLIVAADDCLYKAKTHGRNCIFTRQF